MSPKRTIKATESGVKLLSTEDAAAQLHRSPGRVLQLIWDGKLPAQMVGKNWIIIESDLKFVRDIKRGRPFKNAGADKTI